MTRTFSRETFTAARQAWIDGDFSEEWRPYREQAAQRGMIFPPEGTKFDSWEDDDPSQRAMLIRAIRETPGAVRQGIDRARSWGDVVRYVIAHRDGLRDDAEFAERDMKWRKEHDEPDHREAAATVGAILQRLADGAGVVLLSAADGSATSPTVAGSVSGGPATSPAVEANSFAPAAETDRSGEPSESPVGQGGKERHAEEGEGGEGSAGEAEAARHGDPDGPAVPELPGVVSNDIEPAGEVLEVPRAVRTAGDGA